VGFKIDAVDERHRLGISFDFHINAVQVEHSRKTGAVVAGDEFIAGQSNKLALHFFRSSGYGEFLARGKGAKRSVCHKSRPCRFGLFAAVERKVMAFGTTISFLSVPTSPLNGFYVATVRTAGIAYFLCIKDESTSGLKVFSYSINENRHFTNPKVSGAAAKEDDRESNYEA